MNMADYCGSMDYSILQFSIELTTDVRSKIISRTLFYEEQVVRYIKKQILSFFNNFSIKPALQCTYQAEMLQTVLFKLQPTIKEQQLFQCI
ncbi:hypothetical protein FZC66_10835 [Priestia megaterium]|nr:hypothetical protein FZC66_10835 [Priestia megaterium]